VSIVLLLVIIKMSRMIRSTNIWTIWVKLRLARYVPNIHFVLQDVDQEEKEDSLHS
jgi:hypothetical protein